MTTMGCKVNLDENNQMGKFCWFFNFLSKAIFNLWSDDVENYASTVYWLKMVLIPPTFVLVNCFRASSTHCKNNSSNPVFLENMSARLDFSRRTLFSFCFFSCVFENNILSKLLFRSNVHTRRQISYTALHMINQRNTFSLSCSSCSFKCRIASA